MGKSSEKLRREKLWWCAENNAEMKVHSNAPAQHLLRNMPNYCKRFFDDMEKASNNLQQYLGSEKPDYWKNRLDYIRELSAAISLPVDIWNMSDFDQFRDAARMEYRRLGILREAASQQYESMYSLLTRLHSLKAKDGLGTIKFEVESNNGAVLGFRRKLNTSKIQEFYDDDFVRIYFQPSLGGYALLFFIDPVNNCQIVAPTSHQNDTRILDGVFHVPTLSEPRFHPPEKKGWHHLYALASPTKLMGAIANTDGDKILTPREFELLLSFCVEALETEAVLCWLDFYVKDRK